MNTQLKEFIKQLDINTISEERKQVLNYVIEYLKTKPKEEIININFICTHNSRRSHLGQIWMQTMADFFNIKNIRTYSGGTEATAMAKPIVDLLQKQGFQVTALSNENNTVFAIKNHINSLPIIGFSKRYEHSFNPSSNFIAIMTCSQADEGCPFVAGCDKRFAITYEDPKLYDNTELEAEKYLERSIQIATEMKYIITKIL